ncbi:hypothetical protein P692DRAFT_201807212 [Suillus brevipes Sb2]|nr:hypothetical protein P692DRAFT_201807212 [Suillus brevipes Sb2]
MSHYFTTPDHYTVLGRDPIKLESDNTAVLLGGVASQVFSLDDAGNNLRSTRSDRRHITFRSYTPLVRGTVVVGLAYLFSPVFHTALVLVAFRFLRATHNTCSTFPDQVLQLVSQIFIHKAAGASLNIRPKSGEVEGPHRRLKSMIALSSSRSCVVAIVTVTLFLCGQALA